jgi:hypothetical protein
MIQEATDTARAYTMPEWIMLVGAITAALTAVITGIGNIIVTIRTSESLRSRLKENTVISAETLTKTAVIEGHVNSERAKMTEQLASKDRETELLKSELSSGKQTAALLAQAVAGKDPNAPHDRRAEDKQ